MFTASPFPNRLKRRHSALRKPIAPAPDFVSPDTPTLALCLADTIQRRCEAWRLVYESYLAVGYAKENRDGLWYGLHDALPAIRTLLMKSERRPVATLTLIPDTVVGLPADSIYEDKLSPLRAQGHRLCEVASLARDMSAATEGHTGMRAIFRAAYSLALHLDHFTDFVITVNPRHVGYYRRYFRFEVWGEERSYGKVGAPAVLLKLDLTRAQELFETRTSMASEATTPFMFAPDRINPMLAYFAAHFRPLKTRDVRKFFVENRSFFKDLTAEKKAFFANAYPQLGAEAFAIPAAPAIAATLPITLGSGGS
jgi:hypothetical protein